MQRATKLSLVAVGLFAAHAALVTILGARGVGPFLSDSLQFAIAMLAAFACYHAGEKARYPARWFWVLVASWCLIWSCGQALLLYFGYFGPTPHNTAPQFLTFFFAATPLFMALFLVSDHQSYRVQTDDLLDALQIVVVVSAAYLFFIYVPGTVRGERAYQVLRLQVLHVRNVVLTAGLTWRGLLSRSRTIRRLFLPGAVIMGVYTVGTWLGNHAEELWGVQGTGFDLAWSLPFALWAMAAAAWRDRPEAVPGSEKSKRIPGPVVAYSVPLFLPFLVLLPGSEAMRGKLAVAAAAVAASFVCYGIRLLVVEQRERGMIEALAKTEEQLRQSQKMEAIGTLAGGVAHDFNNLLTVITGYTELALGSVKEDEPEHRWLEEINRSAKRGAELVRQLLAFSRRQVLQPRVLDLNRVLTEMRDMLQRLIGERVDVTMKLESGLPAVKADPGKIEQVVMNLAVNARDAMPNGGRLTITTKRVAIGAEQEKSGQAPPAPGDYVLLAVQDNGTGMDAATRARIFEPFFTTKEMGRGTGLGLSTVYGIVQQSGGWVAVESELGKGTTFEIYFPKESGAEDEVRQREPSRAAKSSKPTNATLLLVEDDAEIRELAHQVLEMNEYRVLDAGSSAEAEKLNAEYDGDIALVISDVMVPGDDGPSLVRKLVARRPRMKVLFVSGYTQDKIVERGVLNSGINFLQKPFTPSELAAKVREVLDGAERSGN